MKKFCARSQPTIAAKAAISTRAGYSSNNTSRNNDFPNTLIATVCEIHITCGIHGQMIGLINLGTGGWPAIAAKTSGARSGDSGNDACRCCYFPDTIVGLICNIYIARGIYSYSVRSIELCICTNIAIATISLCAITCNSGNHISSCIYFPDAVSGSLCDIYIARFIHGYTSRII